VLTPIKRPALSRSGPPELPGLMAASVWITSWMVRPVTAVISRPSALTIPVVKVWSSPKGLPMAKTFCPTNRSLDSPRAIGRSLSAGALICKTARSRSGAAPTSTAFQDERSARVTSRRLASENRELRLLLGLRESRDDLKLAPAEIVVRDVNPFFRIERMRLKLAASTNQSRPASGNAVITDIGLVGRITEIRGSFADVMLVSDYRSRVAAQVNGTGVIGMVVGSGRKSGYLARLQVSMSEPALLKGAVVVTSGHDRVFPRGIEIGYILDPEARRQVGPFMEYDVALAVDPSLADVVMVVTELAAAEALDAFEVR